MITLQMEQLHIKSRSVAYYVDIVGIFMYFFIILIMCKYI